jgi:23S rRNA (adenine2030-N6)-methyltransferase
MLGYQHEYHAGNHGDVLKHAVLALLIRALQRKPGAIRVLDGYAGSGAYDLRSREARRNAEHEQGIARVLAAAAPPPALDPYLDVVRSLNPGGGLRHYPGSPLLTRRLLRPGDQLELLELHPRALGALRRRFRADRQVHIHERDCCEGLPALLPPPERRGLVLLDPSYEVKEEFARVLDLFVTGYRRWPTGVYALWYPLIRDRRAERFPVRVAETGIRRIYRVELAVADADFNGMRGCGVLIANLPFGLEATLAGLMPWLGRVLARDEAGRALAHWLVPE